MLQTGYFLNLIKKKKPCTHTSVQCCDANVFVWVRSDCKVQGSDSDYYLLFYLNC